MTAKKEKTHFNRTALIREIIKDMQPPYDFGRIMLIANTRISQLPKEEGVKPLTRQQTNDFVSLLTELPEARGFH